MTWLLRGDMMTYDGCAVDHVVRFPRTSSSIFADFKQSITGGVEGLEMRLELWPMGLSGA